MNIGFEIGNVQKRKHCFCHSLDPCYETEDDALLPFKPVMGFEADAKADAD